MTTPKPALPEPDADGGYWYSAEEMHAHAAACEAAAIERCAKLCDEYSVNAIATPPPSDDSLVVMFIRHQALAAGQCAAAIRAIKATQEPKT